MHLRFLKTNKQDLLVARHNVKEVVDYFYLCHFQATLTSYCAQKKIQSQECILRNIQNARWIKKFLNGVCLKVCGLNVLTVRIFSSCFSLPLKLFSILLIFFCFITTRFLFYWFLLPWKGKYFAKYLKSEWYLLPISVE